MTELLPCPFCGVEPLERFEKNINGTKYPDHWFVWCENLDCGAGGESMEETQEAARAAWNKRAPAPAQAIGNPVAWRMWPLPDDGKFQELTASHTVMTARKAAGWFVEPLYPVSSTDGNTP